MLLELLVAFSFNWKCHCHCQCLLVLVSHGEIQKKMLKNEEINKNVQKNRDKYMKMVGSNREYNGSLTI